MANKEDHPTYAEALYGLDSCDFISAMETEIFTLIEQYEKESVTTSVFNFRGEWIGVRSGYKSDTGKDR